MKRSSLFLSLFLPFAASAQWSGGGTVNGIPFKYQTRLEPASPGINKTGGGLLIQNNVAKRHFCDFSSNRYFGYDLTLTRVGDDRYQLHVAALSMAPQQMQDLFQNQAGWTPHPPPSNSAVEIVRPGDTIALDLFLNPVTGQKIVDYITIGTKVNRPAPPLFVTLADGTQLQPPSGKVCVIEFLLPNCNHCGPPAQMLSRLKTEFGTRNLDVLGVAVDRRTADVISRFVADNRVNFPVGSAEMQSVRDYLNAGMDTRLFFPIVVVVDRTGIIRYQSNPDSGPVDESKLRTLLNSLTAQ